jgi:hypothetical protein
LLEQKKVRLPTSTLLEDHVHLLHWWSLYSILGYSAIFAYVPEMGRRLLEEHFCCASLDK